jgi:hypothetical protein
MAKIKHGIRRTERLSVNIEAELISEGIKYPGFIKNISENGLNAVIYSSKHLTSFYPGALLELNFQPSADKINLHGEINWLQINKNPSYGLIYNLAVEIKKESPEYQALLSASK